MGFDERLLKESALLPPEIINEPREKHQDNARRWQAIPSVVRTPGGRLWVTWYGCGTDEGPENAVLLSSSTDDGNTWNGIAQAIEHPFPCRLMEPLFWYDPNGRLWLFWSQAYIWWDGRGGVWACYTDDADCEKPVWSEPRRLADGVIATKPIVLSSGAWAYCISVWKRYRCVDHKLPEKEFSSLYISEDGGMTLRHVGDADVPERSFDEHMILERRDGSLRMFVRTSYGIGHSFSYDGGKTWTEGEPSGIPSPSARCCIRRLSSGAVLLVNHHEFTGRSHMTAMLSDDDGNSFSHTLLLDERANLSYSDFYEAPDGKIYIVYDRERYADKEILMAVVREEDIRAGKPVTSDCRLKILVNKAYGQPASYSERRPDNVSALDRQFETEGRTRIWLSKDFERSAEMPREADYTLPDGELEVVIDASPAADGDDRAAIALALRLPGLSVNAIYAAPHIKKPPAFARQGMLENYAEAERLLHAAGISPKGLLFKGSDIFLGGEDEAVLSPAAADLIDRAKKAKGNLYVLVLGAATTVASALTLCPEIAKKLYIVWLGGKGISTGEASGRGAARDPYAANLMLSSGARIVHIPPLPSAFNAARVKEIFKETALLEYLSPCLEEKAALYSPTAVLFLYQRKLKLSLLPCPRVVKDFGAKWKELAGRPIAELEEPPSL